MPLPRILSGRLRLPVIGAPMFIVSGPELVIAQCEAGIVGSFPALNARPASQLPEWLARITETLEASASRNPEVPVAPFAVNQIVHHSNSRLDEDVAQCVKYKVPIIITSLRAPTDIVPDVHGYGGLVFHDVTTVRHAEKAIEAGVDGLILVCAGAGGHAGVINPIALTQEVRRFYDGPIILSGTISTGSGVLAARAMGADLAYMGTRFIATKESRASDEYKQMLVDGSAKDIVYTPYFSGVPGSYLGPSIQAAGLDPTNLPDADKSKMNFGGGDVEHKKAWRDIWSAGQGIGSIDDVPTVSECVSRLEREYREALAALTKDGAVA